MPWAKKRLVGTEARQEKINIYIYILGTTDMSTGRLTLRIFRLVIIRAKLMLFLSRLCLAGQGTRHQSFLVKTSARRDLEPRE